MQVVVDVFCSLEFAKVYTWKMPITACDLLCDRVPPFYKALGVEVSSRGNATTPQRRVGCRMATVLEWEEQPRAVASTEG